MEEGAGEMVSGIMQLNQMPGLAGCKFGMVTMLRHPAAQLLSAYHYTQDTRKVALARFAAGFTPDALLGVRSPLRSAAGAGVNSSSVEASIALADRVLWSRFDVVGHTERFEETLLRISDRFGVQHLLAQALPNNVGPCFSASSASSDQSQVDSGEYSASEWDAAVALRPQLSSWYAKRLADFDAATRSDGDGTFANRVAALRKARERVAAYEASPHSGAGRPCTLDDLLTRATRAFGDGAA